MSNEGGERPNFLVIMSDQHNAGIMGCSGNAIVQTPHLDALAREGVNFTSAYCPHPLCVPARMGFMTAQYPGEVDSWSNASVLSSNVPTFAHALGMAGYEAVLCGRMHFTGPDQFHGFEARLFPDCDGFLSDEIRGFGPYKTTGQTRIAVEIAGYGKAGYQAYDEVVTERALDYLASRPAGGRPFCLVVGYVLPHNPLICARELFEYYMAKLPVPPAATPEYMSNLNAAIRKWREHREVDLLTPE